VNCPDQPFARWIDSTPKYVASSIPDSVDQWSNSTLIKGSVSDFVAELRQQDGRTIGTAGSPSLVRSLIDQEQLDRLTLMISPVAAGGGRMRLFVNGAALTKFKLVEAPADQQWRTDRDLPADPIADQDRVCVRPESALHPAGRTPR